MKVSEIMSYNVVTIPSNTSIAEAKRLMIVHKISHLPVVDKEKLAGIVTDRILERASPGKATALSIWELTYLLEKTRVREIMKKEILSVTPDTDAERAVAIAVKNKISSLVVLEKDRIVGILTTTDFFNKIINSLLGINVPGSRIELRKAIVEGKGAETVEKIFSLVNKLKVELSTIHIEGEYDKYPKDVCIHVNIEDVANLIKEFELQGFNPVIRNR